VGKIIPAVAMHFVLFAYIYLIGGLHINADIDVDFKAGLSVGNIKIAPAKSITGTPSAAAQPSPQADGRDNSGS